MSSPVLPEDVLTIEERIRRDVLRAFGLAGTSIVLSRLERTILERNIEAAIQQVGLQLVANALAQMQSELPAVREIGWQALLSDLPKAMRTGPLVQETLGGYALRNPMILDAIRQQDLSRIQGITSETQQAIRDAITRALGHGTHPSTVAKEIRGVIGLNRRQMAAVEKYRASLAGRKPEQITRMVDRYTKRQLNIRARAIAATETTRARTEGFRAQAERLQADGVYAPGQMEQEWITAHDERVCPVCGPLDGQRTPIGAQFVTEEGLLDGPAAHTSCRCILRLVPKGFRQGQPTAPARDRILAGLGTLHRRLR